MLPGKMKPISHSDLEYSVLTKSFAILLTTKDLMTMA